MITAPPHPARSRRPRAGHFSRGRALGALLGVPLLVAALVGGRGALAVTDAAWTSEATAQANYEAVAIEPVQNLSCFDNRSVPGTGLLQTEIRLEWDRPSGIPAGVPVEYAISWTSNGSDAVITQQTEYKYRARPAVLAVGLTFRVTPRVRSWNGPTTGYSAAQLVVLVPLSISCGILLGIL